MPRVDKRLRKGSGRILVAVLCLAAVVLLSSLPVVGNTVQLITGSGYFVPDRSSIFTFTPVVDNPGSGEWWLVGEDRENYYANAASIDLPRYALLPKEDAAACKGFVLAESRTWETCKGLEFVGGAFPLFNPLD